MEHADVHGNLYGTSFAAIQALIPQMYLSKGNFDVSKVLVKVLMENQSVGKQIGANPFGPLTSKDICFAGQHCVLDIDVEGVKSLKAYLAHQARETVQVM